MAICPACGDKRCPRALNHLRRCEKAVPIEAGKIVCRCGWMGHESQLRAIAHPSKPMVRLLACPRCDDPDRYVGGCDVAGCRQPSISGVPTKAGWRSVCREHYDETDKERHE